MSNSIKGGEFLIRDTKAEDIFIPEQWDEETLMIAKSCRDFLEAEVFPHLNRIDNQEEGLMQSILEKAAELGLTVLAEILAHGMVAGPDASLVAQPARAIKKAAAKAGLDPSGLDLYEMNEAFASVALVSMDQLGIDDSKVNVNGGAIALGHPIGMSGARIVLHLANELKRRGGGTGAAALCGGGGQGDALIIRVP